ncbi:MAG: glutaredoxin domain-containing protein [Burkholderiaceae bacterium]
MNAVRARSLLGLVALVAIGFAAMQGFAWWSRERLGAQVAAEARPGDIQMIASVTCTYCAAARAWFDANRVPFTECMIESDAACAATYAALMAPGTPVMVVRGKRLLGFDAQAIADTLAARPL